MAKTIMTGYDLEHPAPLGDRVPKWLLFTALFGPPAAWFIELCTAYGLTSEACFTREVPLPGGLGVLPWVWPLSLGLNLFALALGFLGAAAAFWMWRRVRYEVPDTFGLLEAGHGRTRFLAVWGIWTGAWFALNILFGTIGFVEVATCGN